MATDSEPNVEAAPAAAPAPAPEPPIPAAQPEPSAEAPPPSAPVAAAPPTSLPRITPAPVTGERLPTMIERTRRRGRRRRAPTFTPQEVKSIDYKDVDQLKKLISDRGRIEPRRKTGLTAKDQRKLAREIKRAREMALLPYTAEHMRQTSRFRMVTRAAQRAMRAELDDAPPSEPVEGGAANQDAPPAEPAAEAAPVTTQAPISDAPVAPTADVPAEPTAAAPAEAPASADLPADAPAADAGEAND